MRRYFKGTITSKTPVFQSPALKYLQPRAYPESKLSTRRPHSVKLSSKADFLNFQRFTQNNFSSTRRGPITWHRANNLLPFPLPPPPLKRHFPYKSLTWVSAFLLQERSIQCALQLPDRRAPNLPLQLPWSCRRRRRLLR